MRELYGVFLIVLMGVLGFIAGRQHERAEDARWMHVRPAFPMTHHIFKGKVRDNKNSDFTIISDTGISDHPDVMIDSKKFVWIEREVTHHDCEKCHEGRWNVESGNVVHPQRLGWIKSLGISPILPERPVGQEVTDDRLKPRKNRQPEA